MVLFCIALGASTGGLMHATLRMLSGLGTPLFGTGEAVAAGPGGLPDAMRLNNFAADGCGCFLIRHSGEFSGWLLWCGGFWAVSLGRCMLFLS